jgi:HlyD family secretion protein
LIVLLFASMLARSPAAWAQPQDKRAPAPAAPAAPAAAPARTIRATGTLEPADLVLVTAKVPGTLKDITIDFATPVRRGAVLAHLDDTLYSAQVELAQAKSARARAELECAKAKLGLADVQVRRAGELAKADPAARDADLQSAQLNHSLARAELAAAEASLVHEQVLLKQAQTALDATVIKSPIDGVVISMRAMVGQTVGTEGKASELFLIGDLSRMNVRAAVAEADIPKVHEGQSARFTVDAFPGRFFDARVTQIRLDAVRTRNATTYTVLLATDADEALRLPYLTANVEINAGAPVPK